MLPVEIGQRMAALCNDAPRSPVAATYVALLTQHLLWTWARAQDCLVLDIGNDAEFIERCWDPEIRKLRTSASYEFRTLPRVRTSDPTKKAEPQHAVCEVARFTGASVDKEATSNPKPSTSTTPLMWYETDTVLGGVAIYVKSPLPKAKLTDQQVEQELTAAARNQAFSDVVRRTQQRARMLFFSSPAHVIEFDRGTLTFLFMNSFLTARTLGIEAPYSMRYTFSAAALVCGSLSPFIELVTSHTRVEQLINSYIDFDLLSFYASVIENCERVRSIGYAHAIEADRAVTNLALDIAAYPEEMAAESSGSTAEAARLNQDGGVRDEELYSQLLDEGDLEEIRNFRAVEANNDDDGDEITTEQLQMLQTPRSSDDAAFEMPASVAPSSRARSVNSNVSSATGRTTMSAMARRQQLPNGENGFRRTPFRVIHGQEYEFSDRLRSAERIETIDIRSSVDRHMYATEYLVRKLPPLRLVRRFTQTFACAIRVVDEYLHYALDVWSPMDFYYLHMFVDIELRERTTHKGVTAAWTADNSRLQARTRESIDKFIDLNRRLVAADRQQLALAKVDRVELARLVKVTVDSALDQSPASLSTTVKQLFGPDISLHSILDNFQTHSQLTMRQRRSRAAFVRCVVVPTEELMQYLENYALLHVAQRIEACNTACPFEPITHRVLRFESSRVTPMALCSSLRAFGARDGDDVMVVWTPMALPPMQGYIYVAMRVTMWRRLVDVIVPRTVAEHRSLDRVCRFYPLVSPALVRALDSPDLNVVVEALAGIQTLFSRSPASLPVQWASMNDLTVMASARRAVESLRSVAHTLQHTNAERTLECARIAIGAEMVEAVRQQKGVTIYNSLYSPVQVAMAGGRTFLFMSTERVEKFLNEYPPEGEADDSPPIKADLERLRALLQQQLSATRNDSTIADIGEGHNELQRDTCRCGVGFNACPRLHRAIQLRTGVQHPGRLERGLISLECCVCARVKLGNGVHQVERARRGERDELGERVKRKRDWATSGNRPHRRRMTMIPSMCDACQDRIIVTSAASAHRGQFVPIFDPVMSVNNDGSARGVAMNPERIIRVLSHPARKAYLYALRVGPRASRVCKTVLPRTDGKDGRQHRDPTEISDVEVGPRGAGLSYVIESTKTMAALRIERNRVADVSHEDGHANDLLSLVIQAEVFALSNHRELMSLREKGHAVGDRLSVFTDEQLTALRVDDAEHDANGMIHRERGEGNVVESTFLFPICSSALVETTGIWHPSAASSPLRGRGTAERVASLLYAGRMPRPLLNMPQGFAELLLINWYNANDSTSDDADAIEE
jgi:hypothetical protein